MKPFETEADLRSWYKTHKKGTHFWCEAAGGGTFGIPDVYTIEGGRVLFFELKMGEIVDGLVQFNMHNAQRIVLRKIVVAGGNAMVLVAIKGTTDIYLAWGDKPVAKMSNREGDAVRGRVPHVIPPANKVDRGSFS